MVGGLEAGRRVAAAALLAFGSMAPHHGPLLAAPAQIAPVADTGVACPLTVGTATTDPALSNDAARAIAVGYAITDCMPDAELLAAAEARALIPMGTPAATAGSGIVGASSGIVGTSSGSAAGATANGSAAVTPPTTASPPTSPATSDTTTADTTTADTATATSTITSETTSETSSDDGSSIGSSDDGSDSGSSDGDTGNQVDNGGNSGVTDDGDTDSPTTDSPTTDATATAADTFAWGTPAGVEDFDGTLSNWGVYDGPGHAGNGRRSPSAVTVSDDGILTITGDPNGTTGGMAWRLGGAKYGRWEARVKSPVADPTYNAVMLLWPDAENGPAGGEVDFMEISDATRQKTDFFLHYGKADHQLHGEKVIDATQWHNWAVEWTPTTITGYVDGVAWFSTTRADALPPGPMHLTLQLDWFPGSAGGAVRQSEMQVDWVRYYPVDGSGSATAITTGETNTATTTPFAGTTSSAVTATSTATTATSSTTTAPTSSAG